MAVKRCPMLQYRYSQFCCFVSVSVSTQSSISVKRSYKSHRSPSSHHQAPHTVSLLFCLSRSEKSSLSTCQNGYRSTDKPCSTTSEMTRNQVPMPMAEGVSEKILNDPSELGDKDSVEPIAVVGLSFEFPQEATSTDAFWELLINKRNTATEIPNSRLSVSAMYHPDRNRKGQVDSQETQPASTTK